MNTNGNNLSLTIFKKEPYLPTEIWDIINYYKYMYEIQDKIKEKRAMFDGIHNTFKFASKIGVMDIYGKDAEEEPITLFHYFCAFGIWGFSEELPKELWVDYYNIWDSYNWDYGGGMGIGSIREFLEVRESEGLFHDQGYNSIYWTPADCGISEGMLKGEEEVY